MNTTNTTHLSKPRVLFVGTASENYPSNRIKIGYLKSYADITTLFSNLGSYYLRTLSVVIRLPFYVYGADVIWVGWMGHQLMPILKMLTTRPIIFDLQNSLFEAMCLDRKYCKPESLIGRVLNWLDGFAYKKASLIVVHDEAHKKRLKKQYHTPDSLMIMIPMCADLNMFYPREQEKSENFVVEFCGELSPVHGVQYIVRAAKLLEFTNVKFKIAGRGQCSKMIDELILELKPKNLERRGYISDEELINQRKNADLSLGAFGVTARNYLMINKYFEITAMAKPLLTLRPEPTSPIFEFFEENKNIFMVPPGDPKAISDKILWIRDHIDERNAVASLGRESFINICSKNQQINRVRSAVVRVYGDW